METQKIGIFCISVHQIMYNVSQLKNHKKSKLLEDQELFYQEVAP